MLTMIGCAQVNIHVATMQTRNFLFTTKAKHISAVKADMDEHYTIYNIWLHIYIKLF